MAVLSIVGAITAAVVFGAGSGGAPHHVRNVDVSPVQGSSAITSMWAWGNAVPADLDYRGLGEPEFQPATIASFVQARQLSSVRLSVPWAADEGTAIRQSLSDSVVALHATGATVSALGGDNEWVANPALASQWMTAAKNAAAFDAVQLDVEPWTDPNWTTNKPAIAQYITLIARAQTTAHSLGMRLGVDVPWWLAAKRYGSSTILAAVLARLDSVSIVTFVDHASGSDGIVALSSSAASQAVAAHKPFTIGVETDTPAVAGGAQYTFYDEGSAVLEAAASTVRVAYASTPGYGGVTIEHYLSWLALAP